MEGSPTHYLAKVYRKLRENEENLVTTGGGFSYAPLDQPMRRDIAMIVYHIFFLCPELG